MFRRTFLQFFGLSPIFNFFEKKQSIPESNAALDAALVFEISGYQTQAFRAQQIKESREAKQKAFACLLAVGFKEEELEQVREDIANTSCSKPNHQYGELYDDTPLNIHYCRFNSGYFKTIESLRNNGLNWDWSKSKDPFAQHVWDALVISFRTGRDGFAILGVNPFDDIIKLQGLSLWVDSMKTGDENVS